MDATPPRVLVLGAGRGMALFLRLVLSREGFEVACFADLAAVVLPDEQDSSNVAVVIVDIEAPRFLRPRAPLPRHELRTTPVILLVGSDHQQVRHAWGADAAIEKPFSEETLTSTVRALARSA